jgi:hypothetical protein
MTSFWESGGHKSEVELYFVTFFYISQKTLLYRYRQRGVHGAQLDLQCKYKSFVIFGTARRTNKMRGLSSSQEKKILCFICCSVFLLSIAHIPTHDPLTSYSRDFVFFDFERSAYSNNETSSATSSVSSTSDEVSTPSSDENPLDAIMKNNTYPSLNILFNIMKNYSAPDGHKYGDEIIDIAAESERCKRYGFEYNSTQKTRRRIFFGSLIADDSWHAILAHAAEVHGLYHTVSFVESNSTLSMDKSQSRKTRFHAGSTELRALQESGIFGPSTKVDVDIYIDHPEDRKDEPLWNGVEMMQRNRITRMWKQNGMTENDIGILSDLDEVFSRDFLFAAQSCDIPEFRPNQDCHKPKLLGKTLVFEASPECITDQQWYHPDMILGECIDTVGDYTVHKPGKRSWNGTGPRKKGYGKEDDYSLMPNTTMYPLWTSEEIRTFAGGRQVGIGFHMHNFFLSTSVLRNKYFTYGHNDARAMKLPLGQISPDINVAINCATGRPDAADASKKRIEGGFQGNDDDPRPVIYKQSAEYREARHQELRDMILEDEKEFGIYNAPKEEEMKT